MFIFVLKRMTQRDMIEMFEVVAIMKYIVQAFTNYSWCSLSNKVDPTVLSTYRKKKYVLIVLSRPYLHNLSQNYPFNAKIIFCRKT